MSTLLRAADLYLAGLTWEPLNVAKEVSRARDALAFFGDRPLGDFAGPAGGALVRGYLDDRIARGRSYVTMRCRMLALRHVLEGAIERGELATMPDPWPIPPRGIAGAVARAQGMILLKQDRAAAEARFRPDRPLRTKAKPLARRPDVDARVPPPGEPGLREALGWVLNYARRRCAPATVGAHEGQCEYLLRWFGNRPLSDFRGGAGYRLIEEYVVSEGPEGRGVKYATVQHRLVSLRMALTEAVKRDVLPAVPPFPEMPADSEPRERYVTYDEFQRLRAALKPDRRIWVDLAVWTAQHPRDIGLMTWGDIDLGGGPGEPPSDGGHALWLRHNRKNRTRPEWLEMPDELRERLTTELRRRGGRHPLKAEPIIGPWPRAVHALRHACFRIGIAPVTSMDLRRTCATWWLENNGPKEALRKWMGHSANSAMIERHYAKITPNLLGGGVSALNRARLLVVAEPSRGLP